jgi:hypothetical protein
MSEIHDDFTGLLNTHSEDLQDDTESLDSSESLETTETESVSAELDGYPEVPEETSTEVGYDPSAVVTTVASLGVSTVFVLSMILGALLFSILSRRWYV